MSRVIWKAALLPVNGIATIHTDVNAKPLTVQLQNGARMIWFETERAPLKTADRQFYVLPTGMADIPDDAGNYLGTVQDAEGYVWHIYERIR